MKISQLLKPNPTVFKGQDTVEHVLSVMNEKKINGAPVVDEENNLIGMVVKADIYRFLIEPGRFDSYPLHLVMSKQVVVASPEEELAQAAKRLRENKIIALPIVEGRKVVGLIAIEDIVDYVLGEGKL